MADYSVHFHEKFILKKSIIFVKLMKQISYVYLDLPGSPKKVVWCTTYNVLGILALILGAIFVENIFKVI